MIDKKTKYELVTEDEFHKITYKWDLTKTTKGPYCTEIIHKMENYSEPSRFKKKKKKKKEHFSKWFN